MGLNAPILLAGMLMGGCGSTYRDVKLGLQRAELQDECGGEFTNTCTAKNIDYDIAVLRSLDDADINPEEKRQMLDLFGADKWVLHQQALDAVRIKYIAMLEAKRPGWFRRWFLGDQQPLDGGVRAFYTAEDLGPFKDQVNEEFARRVRATGWKPTPEQLARYGPSSASSSPDKPLSASDSATPSAAPSSAPLPIPSTHAQAVADAIEAAQARQLAPPAPTRPGGTSSFSFSPEWQKTRSQLQSDPEAFLNDCTAMLNRSAQELGGVDPAANDRRPECEGLLKDYRDCLKLSPEDSQRCYDERNQDLE